MARQLSPDVVLMDLQMPIVDGITAIGELTVELPEISVIALTTFQEPQQVTAALAAGARGYLVKDVEPEVLVAGIRAVVNGGAPLSPSVAAQLLRSAASQPTMVGSVTQRERQILRLIVSGQSNKQIGRELGISEKTVKSHCGRLFQRINVSDRTQAAVWATKNLPPGDD
jgi:DNA-binding NarL/FixJ family response regulator